MRPLDIGLAGLGLVLALIAIRVPIGVALGGVSVIGIALIRGPDVALGILKTSPFDFVASWSLSSIPMFLLMGAVAYHAGISLTLFEAARAWLGRLPGGLAVAANFACAGFSAASGSSVATAAAMGRLTVPYMLAQGYDKALATAVVAAAGTLGSLIPPSILFVLYGIFAQVSISKLLIAGVLPGLLTAAVYAIMIVLRCAIDPRLAPPVRERYALRERIIATRGAWPVMLLILGIMGGIYGGIVTATEAGALGALLAFAIAAARGRLTVEVVRESVMEALTGTARIFFIGVGAVLLSRFLALAGVPPFFKEAIGAWALDPLLLVLATSVLYLILGCFLDPIGLMLLTLPILIPMFQAAKMDLIWLGVIVVKYLEIGLLTPPVGLNVYVIKSVVGNEVPLETIFRGVFWFLACEVVIMALIIGFPGISLYLPSMMD